MNDRIIDRWEVDNGFFKMRLTEYERITYMSPHRFDYVFESAPNGSKEWRQIMTIRQTDDRKVKPSQARFVNERIAFSFLGPRYAVTLDGGVHWSIWDAVEQLPNWRRTYLFISEVTVLDDGTGELVLLPSSSNDTPKLITKDFGKHWNLE